MRAVESLHLPARWSRWFGLSRRGLGSADQADLDGDNIGDACDAAAGDLLIVPDRRHSLEALDEAVVLLTVAKLR